MDSPQSETSLTEDAVQTTGGRIRAAISPTAPAAATKSSNSTPTLRPKYVQKNGSARTTAGALRRSPYALVGRHRQLQSGRIQHPHQRLQSRVSLTRERAIERLAAQAAPLGHEPDAMRRRDLPQREQEHLPRPSFKAGAQVLRGLLGVLKRFAQALFATAIPFRRSLLDKQVHRDLEQRCEFLRLQI